MDLTIEEVAKVVCGEVLNCSEEVIKKVVIDSRKVSRGDLFVALRGEKFDGHDFIHDAVKNGAISCISSQKLSYPIILVDDTLKALQKLASYYRDKINLNVVAITGSVGKTTTKEYVYNVISGKYNTSKTDGNLNNHIGLPLSILNIQSNSEYAVLEMGMSNFGEISTLSKIAKPRIGIITNIGVAHIENLRTRENIFKAKSEIQDGMDSEGILIVNNDNDILYKYKSELTKRVVTIGIEQESDFMAKSIEKASNGFKFNCEGEKYEIETLNFHDIYNSLFAVAVGKILDVEYNLIKEGIMRKNQMKHRFEITKKANITFIDDTYNASTQSMISALETLQNLNNRRKIAVLGDMLELGDFTENEHREIGKFLKNSKIDIVFCIGKRSRFIYEELVQSKEVYWFDEKEKALALLISTLKDGDAVLFKASRGMSLDKLFDKVVEGVN